MTRPGKLGAESANVSEPAKYLTKTIFLTAIALVAFAGNSVLARLAMAEEGMDAASFTAIRLSSGAIALACILGLRWSKRSGTASTTANGDWRPAFALLAYAAAFSFAYLTLSAGTGALILFAAVQMTMLLVGFLNGERFAWWQGFGLLLAFAGLGYLVSPGVTAPPFIGSILMLISGVAWGFYSLSGRGVVDPILSTARNFVFAAPVSVALAIALWGSHHLTSRGIVFALASGAITSGLGYVVWYAALPRLGPTQAATVQLLVPVIAALAGVVFLSEVLSGRFVGSSTLILGGVALTLRKRIRS